MTYVFNMDIASTAAVRKVLNSGTRSNLLREEDLRSEQAVEHVDDIPDADGGCALRRRAQRAPELAADALPIGSAAYVRVGNGLRSRHKDDSVTQLSSV